MEQNEWDKYIMSESNKKQMDECFRELAEAERKIKSQNLVTIREACKISGRKSFKKYLKRLIEENEVGSYGSYYQPHEIVSIPKGGYQKEDGFGSITGMWVDQRSVGDSGDSYAGTVTVSLNHGKYLEMAFAC